MKICIIPRTTNTKEKERGFVSGIVDSIQQGAQQVLSLFTEETQNVENETVLQNIIYDASAVKYIENCPYIAQHKSHFVDLLLSSKEAINLDTIIQRKNNIIVITMML